VEAQSDNVTLEQFKNPILLPMRQAADQANGTFAEMRIT